MSTDGGLRPLFHSRLKSGFHWQAIETGGTGRGIPDSNFCCGGVERWVEFKVTDAWAVGLSPEQVAWHTERQARGGVTFVAVRRKHDGGVRKGSAVDELWLYSGRDARRVRADGLRVAPIAVFEGGPGVWDWERIRRILLS